MGFASSPATRTALAGYGVRVTGYTWRWALGLKGGTFPPHYEQNGEQAPTSDSFSALPGEDVNGDSCNCRLVPVYRTPDGRFARPDNLTPIFQPPVTAAMELYRPPELDLEPLVAALAIERPMNVSVTIPDGAIVVNLPKSDIRPPDVVVNVPKGETVVNVSPPDVSVAAPNVTVETPTVNVAAPTVKVEPRIDVKPVVKVIREKAKKVRFRRNANGLIEEAEVTQ